MQDAPSLLQELTACRALIAEQSSALAEVQSSREKLSQENEELNLTIQKLLSRLAGHRSERHEDPAQQQLDFGEHDPIKEGVEDAAEELLQARDEIGGTPRTRKPRKVRNEQLPEHLPRYEVIAPASPDQEQCAEHGPRQLIGYDVTETLEFERPKLRVRVTKYPKFACAAHPECGVGQAPRPAGLVEGNRFDTSIAAEIVTGKYAFHL